MSVSSSPLHPSHPSLASPLLGSILQRQRRLVERQGTWSRVYSSLTSHHALLAGALWGRPGTHYSTFLPSAQHRQFLRPASPSPLCIPPLDWNHRTEWERARVQAYSLQCVCAEIQVSFVLFKKKELCNFCDRSRVLVKGPYFH